jgi:superfamily II DNA or RNA helicase
LRRIDLDIAYDAIPKLSSMINIAYDNINAILERPIPTEAHKLLWDALKYHPDGFEHVYTYQSGKWDGFTRLYDSHRGCFRRGLLTRVVDLLGDAGYPTRATYVGPKTVDQINYQFQSQQIKLFDFQQKVPEIVTEYPIGIIVSPTGSGKTVCIALAINALKLRCMIMVTDVVLLDQMVQALQRYFNHPIGMIGDGEFDLQNITVSTIQSLLSITRGKAISSAQKRKALLDHLKGVGVLISDEAHLYDSEGVAEVMPYFNQTTHFYGFSATPYGWAERAEKRQNLELEQHFGRIIYDCRKLDFLNLGLKVPVAINVVNRIALNQEYKRHQKRTRYGIQYDWGKNYHDCLEQEIITNPQYHEDVVKKVWDLACHGQSVFVHAAHKLEFGQTLKDLIPGAVLVNGKTPRLERRTVYDALRKKELLVLVSDVGGTGLDIPSLNVMALASDLKDIRQLLGRVARRPMDGSNKEYGIALDFHTQTQFLSKHHQIRHSQYEHEHCIIA